MAPKYAPAIFPALASNRIKRRRLAKIRLMRADRAIAKRDDRQEAKLTKIKLAHMSEGEFFLHLQRLVRDTLEAWTTSDDKQKHRVQRMFFTASLTETMKDSSEKQMNYVLNHIRTHGAKDDS